MGRKEGGSLFHQLIHAPGVMTLADRKASDGSEMDVSFKTRENYYAWLHKAADYFKSQGIRSIKKIGRDEIQAYADMLSDKGLSAFTIHSYLSPVCKATGAALKEIDKPIRHASEFTRSGGGGKKYGGRPSELNELVGIRENELRHLRGNDFIRRGDDAFVVVRRGKGGKFQEQRILPEHVTKVESFCCLPPWSAKMMRGCTMAVPVRFPFCTISFLSASRRNCSAASSTSWRMWSRRQYWTGRTARTLR